MCIWKIEADTKIFDPDAGLMDKRKLIHLQTIDEEGKEDGDYRAE
jgi:hypothetical protein